MICHGSGLSFSPKGDVVSCETGQLQSMMNYQNQSPERLIPCLKGLATTHGTVRILEEGGIEVQNSSGIKTIVDELPMEYRRTKKFDWIILEWKNNC